MPPKTGPNGRNQNKAQVAEKVKEIKQRQQNWLRQRSEHINPDSPETQLQAAKPSSGFDNKKKSTASKTVSNHVSDHGDRKQHIQSKQKGFNTWLKNREEPEESPHVHKDSLRPTLGASYVISKERTEREYNPNDEPIYEHQENSGSKTHFNGDSINSSTGYTNSHVSERTMQGSSNMCPEAFDQLADQIVNRVKNELSIKNKPYYNANQYSDTPSARSSTNSSSMSKSSPDDVKSSFQSTSSASSRNENNYLEGHFCPQCSQLMVGKHDPMLIIPCGHNICKACSELDDVDLCCLCSCEVNSFTCNIMLKQIIGDYKRDKKRMESSRRKESSRRAEPQVEEKDYKEEIKTLMIRLDVLETESDSIKETMDSIKREIKSEHKQVSNIEKQEERIKLEIEELNMKLDGLANHKQDYFDKVENLEQKFSKQEDKLTMVRETIRQLNRDVESIQLSGVMQN